MVQLEDDSSTSYAWYSFQHYDLVNSAHANSLWLVTETYGPYGATNTDFWELELGAAL